MKYLIAALLVAVASAEPLPAVEDEAWLICRETVGAPFSHGQAKHDKAALEEWIEEMRECVQTVLDAEVIEEDE